jgi:hypothetical protein
MQTVFEVRPDWRALDVLAASWISPLLRHCRRRRCGRGVARTHQAQVLALSPSVDSLRVEADFVCAYPVGNGRTTAIADKQYFDHWVSTRPGAASHVYGLRRCDQSHRLPSLFFARARLLCTQDVRNVMTTGLAADGESARMTPTGLWLKN